MFDQVEQMMLTRRPVTAATDATRPEGSTEDTSITSKGETIHVKMKTTREHQDQGFNWWFANSKLGISKRMNLGSEQTPKDCSLSMRERLMRTKRWSNIGDVFDYRQWP